MEGDHYMGEKVPGKIKDKLPVIPDRVVEALNKGVDVPIEAMVSGPAMEMLEDRMRERNEPLRMQNLVPVPKGDPRTQVRFDGQQLPSLPQRRRVIPPPYQRPQAAIRQDHGRDWRDMRAADVKVDDTVPFIGRIVHVDIRPAPLALGPEYRDVGDVVFLTGMGGISKVFLPDAPVKAFAVAP